LLKQLQISQGKFAIFKKMPLKIWQRLLLLIKIPPYRETVLAKKENFSDSILLKNKTKNRDDL